MKKIAIVGTGPTGIYTFFSLINHGHPLAITLFEQGNRAGTGMPYNREDNARIMLANIASIEIPPLMENYLDWLNAQDPQWLARYGVDKHTLHERQFLPRILLGEYFRHQFLALVSIARQAGFQVDLKEACQVTDVVPAPDGVTLWTENHPYPGLFDFVAIATGHVWPEKSAATRAYYPSPWSGLMDARIPPCAVGILGTSLSGIDAAMAVAIQHGTFHLQNNEVTFRLNDTSRELQITLMSRSGILPEADFYCPLPYLPLQIVTPETLSQEIARGSQGLLDRVFRLIVQEITLADPDWSASISLGRLDADTFPDAWFYQRQQRDPFHWAQENLNEVEQHKRQRYTVPWRYAVLRLHEAVQEVVPWLDEHDTDRFNHGLGRVFIDNYAAIPPQSIRRLLALHAAGILTILALGNAYQRTTTGHQTMITTAQQTHQFDVFIDARGQKALQTADLPFPALRDALLLAGETIPPVSQNYTLLAPPEARERVAFGALPWLMHDRPFIQGITACADIGAAIAAALSCPRVQPRRRLPDTEY